VSRPDEPQAPPDTHGQFRVPRQAGPFRQDPAPRFLQPGPADQNKIGTPIGVHGSLNEFAADAVTLDEFIAHLQDPNRNIGDRWNAIVNGRYHREKDASGRTKNFRYVRTPRHPDCIIDMRHFQYVGSFGQGWGNVVEELQRWQHQASAYDRQDLYSNALGEAFINIWVQRVPALQRQHRSAFDPAVTEAYCQALRQFFDNENIVRNAIVSANAAR
jgi:hypothetical protein